MRSIMPTARSLLLLSLASWISMTEAALTDIASSPLVTSPTDAVRPNIMFIMDDSGSMSWTFMPDSVGVNDSKPCYKNSLYNRLYYDPNVVYTPPVRYDGTPFPNVSFTAAPRDGFNPFSQTVDLSRNFVADDYVPTGGRRTAAQPAYYYKYVGPGTPSTGVCYQNSYYQKVIVSATSGPGGRDERQNFANWYSYYRARILAMKTAAGRAFLRLDDRYRLGFMTINTTANSTGDRFLDIDTLTPAHKQAWYDKLYSVSPDGYTPLRSALSKAGRIYAGRIGRDPVQYSCQQNFSILASDGYWNVGNGCNGGRGCKLDGVTPVGNQDNDPVKTPRPMYDGGSDTNADNTLADVAMYYYMTDLRPPGSIGAMGTDVSENNVPPSGRDTASHQHMTTFTIGFGLGGLMTYRPDYETATSGDFYNVRAGTINNSQGLPCPWSGRNKPCNWPVPTSDSPSTVDDLWHAAVNGRGIYVSTDDPASLASGIATALAGVSARLGSSAASTSSTPNVTSSDNFVFSTIYVTVEWSGDLYMQRIDVATGAVPEYNPDNPSTYVWRAQPQLDAMTSDFSDTRNILFYSPGAPNRLKPFRWTSMDAAERAHFGASKASNLSQYTSLSPAEQAIAAGENLVNFLRGQRGFEGSLYRRRAHVLGDIVSAEPVYVGAPNASYQDSGYAGFKSALSGRKRMVYVAANDGMLHAFDADTGRELWAYVPSIVMPELYRLADKDYERRHRFYVDATPVVGDVFDGTRWRTILVGGLGAGGRGYYALDVTDPDNPIALWEFTHDASMGSGYTIDPNMGLSFGNPVITKKKSGRWVVLVTSGYNNVSPGDGRGYLYVLDPVTGAVIDRIGTGRGSAGSPSGLSRISAWADRPTVDNTALRVYGGDLEGNLWRFDIHGGEAGIDVGAPGKDAHLLARFYGPDGRAQPITAKPELASVDGNAVVYVGTGRYLGASDMIDRSVQSFYAIKDPLDASTFDNPRSSMVAQTISTDVDQSGRKIRRIFSRQVDFFTVPGWYVDFPDAGERVNTDPALALGTLVFSANQPTSSPCSVGGNSFLYFLDHRSGGSVPTVQGGLAGITLGSSIASRPVLVRLPGGSVVSLTRMSEGKTVSTSIPASGSSSGIRRSGWREIVD